MSVNNAGEPANAVSDPYPTISANGRYVAFASSATTFVSDDTNGTGDIFVHDRQAGTTQRVSIDSSGKQMTSSSDGGSISGDGSYVVFSSQGNEALIPGGPPGYRQVFVNERNPSPPPDNPAANDDTAITSEGGQMHTAGALANYFASASSTGNLSAPSTQDIDVLANDTELGGGTLTITSNAQPPSGEGSASCTATKCTFVPGDHFSGLTHFTYPITDGQGNTDTATVTIAHPAKKVNPTNGATGVRRLTNVVAVFSKAMDPNTVTTSTFTLVKKGTTKPIPASVTYDATTRTATLGPFPDKPTQKLARRTTYTAKISGAKDLEGNTLPDYSWSFKTGRK